TPSAISPGLPISSMAGFAGARWTETAMVAMKLALPAFLIPYVFTANPAMLLMGSPGEIALGVVSTTIGVVLLAGAAIGYLVRPTGALERIILGAGALALIKPGIVSDLLGLVALAVVLLLRRLPMRRVEMERGA